MIKLKLDIDNKPIFKGKFNTIDDMDDTIKTLKLKLK